MSHEVEGCRRRKASLILVGVTPTRSYHLSILHGKGRCRPSVVIVFCREKVVQGHTDGGILHTDLGQAEVVGQIEIRVEVSF